MSASKPGKRSSVSRANFRYSMIESVMKRSPGMISGMPGG